MTPNAPQTLPHILRNKENLYEGDLVYYARIIFKYAQNLNHPYHNFRHMFHVLWLCHEALRYYRDVAQKPISTRSARNLLLGAVFHDFNHSGQMGDDDLNIERAVRGLRKYALEEDKAHLEDIERIIKGTQFPYAIPSEELDLCGLILRDADASQAFSVAWIQQVIFGLAEEWNMRPVEVLRMQDDFHEQLVFHTEWGRHEFTRSEVDSKVREADELIEIFDDEGEGK